MERGERATREMEKLDREIEQLRREAKHPRLPVSQVSTLLEKDTKGLRWSMCNTMGHIAESIKIEALQAEQKWKSNV